MNNPAPPLDHGILSERKWRLLYGTWAIFLLVPWMLVSSKEYHGYGLLVASVITIATAMPAMWRSYVPRPGASGAVLVSLAVAHIAFAAGGILNGDSPALVSYLGVAGMSGVLALATATGLLVKQGGKKLVTSILLPLCLFLLISSVIGYFISIENSIAWGDYGIYFDRVRMALIWPTRLLLSFCGQLGWEHTNFGAYIFAVTLVLILERECRKDAARWWWALALLLGTAVFTSASRSALCIVLFCIPLLWFRRKPIDIAKQFLLLACCYGLGSFAVMTKIQIVKKSNPGQASELASVPTHQVDALVQRSDSGRFGVYKNIWHSIAPHRAVGLGLSVAGTPVPTQLHEHSTYMSTLRCGGGLALACHLLILATATYAALRLYLNGLRWPLIYLVAVLTGILFDRSGVFNLTGNQEFLFHWTAVFIPLFMANNTLLTRRLRP